jgi:REP element-mobilizing transposase RayT
MKLNELGNIVEEEWLKTEKLRKDVELDYYVIMPNHFHGIIINNSRGTMHRAPTNPKFGNPISGSLSTIIGAFKAAVTRKINRLIKQPVSKIWQRNFYEHIIRNENDLNNIRKYIEFNPLKWELDEYYRE